MATVNKDFKIKYGLIVEGTTAKVNNYDILTKKQDDQDYIVSLIGGTSTPLNTPNSVVKRDANGNFAAGTITADITGDVTGQVSDISNHNTDALSEGSLHLYFTDQRAVTANTGLWDTIGAAAQAEADAILAAQQYTDGEISDEITARNAAIAVSLTSAENYADNAADNAESAAISSANSHTDSQIALEAARADLYADGVGSSTLSSANSYTDSSISSEVTRSNNYADGVGTSTLSSANSYTDGEITALEGRSQSYADSAATTAENNAKAYADGLSSGLNWKAAVNVLATSNVALTGSTPLSIDNHTVSNGYRVLLKGQSTDAENGIYEMSISGGSYTLSRPTDADAASELIGAAVFVMEGDVYASTAWVQADHYLTTFAGQSWTQFSGQGTYLAGNGLTLDGTTFEIDETITATRLFASSEADAAEAAAIAHTNSEISTEVTNRNNAIATAKSEAITSSNGYTDSAISTEVTNRNSAIATAKSEAINTAEDYTDSAISTEVTNRNNAIATAKSEAISTSNGYADDLMADEIVDRNNAINNAINALDTDDIEEGSVNEYFTDARAKTSAADLLVNATKTNITITGTGAGLTITAENGVADSTTDDLDEGTTNLYFTDERAVDALEAVVPNFTEIDINSFATQVAASTAVATASQVAVYSFAKADYRSAKFLVRTSYGTHTEISEVLLTLDTSDNVAITEYATIGTNGSSMSVSADVSGANVRLLVTTVNNSSTVTVMGTLLA